MDVGIQMVFQNYRGHASDDDVMATEMRTALLAEELGFDKVWPVEHHFTDYAACPDNTEFLAWVAGRTTRVKLATGAVILPWNDPLRVAERITLLDYLSDGRAVLGMGRGLARREYAGFGIDMGESRARFDEAGRMILDALDTGFIEGDGPFYPQARTPIRPRPRASFRDRVYAVGMSPDSVLSAADLGARLMVFSQMPWEQFAETSFATYRTRFREQHGREAPPPLTSDLLVCHADAAKAEALAMEHMCAYYLSVIEHYEIMSEHFKQVRGYEMYANVGDLMRDLNMEDVGRGYASVQSYGTPERILQNLERRRALLGAFELNVFINFGGIPFEEAERSLRLFAAEVLPELHRW